MRKAIFIYGPSGVGKSSVAELIAKHHGYKHVDADVFKLIFSDQRSKERSAIGERMGYLYAKELISRHHDVIIEAVADKYVRLLKPYLRKENYRVKELSLVAPLEQCIRNDATRTRKGYGRKVIREVYPKLSYRRGLVIDATGKTPLQVYRSIPSSHF